MYHMVFDQQINREKFTLSGAHNVCVSPCDSVQFIKGRVGEMSLLAGLNKDSYVTKGREPVFD